MVSIFPPEVNLISNITGCYKPISFFRIGETLCTMYSYAFVQLNSAFRTTKLQIARVYDERTFTHDVLTKCSAVKKVQLQAYLSIDQKLIE
jgi:hypothetical protein